MFQTFFKELRAAKLLTGFIISQGRRSLKTNVISINLTKSLPMSFAGWDIFGQDAHEIPADWLRKMAEQHLTPEEMAEIEALGDFEKIMEALKERLENQDKRHEGGNKNIGTAGKSPFGAYGLG